MVPLTYIYIGYHILLLSLPARNFSQQAERSHMSTSPAQQHPQAEGTGQMVAGSQCRRSGKQVRRGACKPQRECRTKCKICDFRANVQNAMETRLRQPTNVWQHRTPKTRCEPLGAVRVNDPLSQRNPPDDVLARVHA